MIVGTAGAAPISSMRGDGQVLVVTAAAGYTSRSRKAPSAPRRQ
jgi:hypothetical protein